MGQQSSRYDVKAKMRIHEGTVEVQGSSSYPEFIRTADHDRPRAGNVVGVVTRYTQGESYFR